MTTKTSTYPLRLPVSLKAALEKMSKEEGTSINQLVVMAIAEKISSMNTAAFFEQRQAKADRDAFLRVLNRTGGEPPRDGDEVS